MKVQFQNENLRNIEIYKKVKIVKVKVKIGLSPELMHDIFEFIEKPYSLRINSQFRPDDPTDKI